MSILLKVSWVDKADQPEVHRRIRRIGGSSRELQWNHTREQAIEYIERGQFAYYVEKDARALELGVGRTADGNKYLKTEADGEPSQLLLDLPPMPPPAVSVTTPS